VLRLLTLAVAATVAAAIFLSASGATGPGSFQLGLVSNADYGSRAAKVARLGTRIVRVEFSIDATPARLAPTIAAFARQGVGVLLLAGFRARIPSAAEARNLATWARAFGPSGSFWQGRSHGALAVRAIEFGNETNQAYQYGGCGPGCSAFAERAHAYALALKEAQEAVDGPLGNPAVGLLAIGDDGGTGSPDWVNGMFDAVPDLAQRVAGWTAHPYGPRAHWQPLLDRLVSQTRARGASASIPIYITELGIATDNGRCLSDNYGWNPCSTYGEAARSLSSTVSAIRARYGSRVRAIFVYQAFDQRPPQLERNREYYFGALTAEGAAKGAYTATIRTLIRALH
jgi:hypothetical protein